MTIGVERNSEKITNAHAPSSDRHSTYKTTTKLMIENYELYAKDFLLKFLLILKDKDQQHYIPVIMYGYDAQQN